MAILNVGSFHKQRNPHVMTLLKDKPFWGLRERDKRFWDRLEIGSRVLVYGEFQGSRGIYLSGLVETKEHNTQPVQEWVKNPTGFPYQIHLKLSKLTLKNVEPISLDELSEKNIPFFQDKPERLISIIFFDESTMAEFSDLWKAFHERNSIPELLVEEVAKDELVDWIGPRFMSLRNGNLTSEEFQKRVNELFRILGFKVIEFPLGPYPDAVLYLPDPYKTVNPFWIVADSKNISGYNMPETDKRAMESYVNSQRLEALDRGLDPNNCYFLLIAPSFHKTAEERLRSIQSNTRASGGLLSIKELLNLTFARFKYGSETRIDKFPELLKGTEITQNKIDYIITKPIS